MKLGAYQFYIQHFITLLYKSIRRTLIYNGYGKLLRIIKEINCVCRV